jgi:hypothetical protein
LHSEVSYKQLEKGHFLWPTTSAGRVSLTLAQLSGGYRGGCIGRNWRVDRGAHAGFIGADSQQSSVSGVFTAPTALPGDPATLQLILLAAQAEIERLRLMIAGLQRNRFGRRSERLDDETLQHGFEDLQNE